MIRVLFKGYVSTKIDKIIQFFLASALVTWSPGTIFHNKSSTKIVVLEFLAIIPAIRQKENQKSLIFRHRSSNHSWVKSKLTYLFFSACMIFLLFLGRVAARTFARMCTFSCSPQATITLVHGMPACTRLKPSENETNQTDMFVSE